MLLSQHVLFRMSTESGRSRLGVCDVSAWLQVLTLCGAGDHNHE